MFQVFGGVQRQGRGLRVRLEMESRVSLCVCLPRPEAFEAGLAVREFVREEGQRGFRRGSGLGSGGGGGVGGAVSAQKEREQVVSFAPLVRTALKAFVEMLRVLPGGHRPGGDVLLRLDVADVHEGRRVADVPVRLLVLVLEHFKDALVAADRGVRALAGQIDDLRGALLSVAVTRPFRWEKTMSDHGMSKWMSRWQV